ncbi:AMP-binding protein [Aneurinibacillus sp. REN35]|uniref:AMP-binding protein n=1 Tax=Aneurinibacillus sp. REN35 TaxID=3237286 RepID=UPI003526C5A0
MAIADPLLRMMTNGLFRVSITGLDTVDFTQPTLLTPNHISLLDAAVLAMNLPTDVCFVVNTEVAKQFASLLKLRRHITVDPMNPLSVRQMIRLVQQGTPLVIFPEGRITRTGGLMKIYSGMGYIALKTGARIYPITLEGPERSKLSYLQDKMNTKMFPEIKVRIGEPYRIQADSELPLRLQKEQTAYQILQVMQRELFISRHKAQANLFDEVVAQAKINGYNTPICEDPGQSVNYKKLLIASYALASKFSALLGTEQNIGVFLPNSVGHVATLLALFQRGKTPVILNFTMGRQTLAECAETANIRTVLTSHEFIAKGKLAPQLADLKDKVRFIYLEDVKQSIGPQDRVQAVSDFIAKKKAKPGPNELILFTSGSENKPKGVVLSHANLYANVMQITSVIDVTPKDKILNALPMFHSFGLTIGTFLPLLTGVSVYLYPTPLHYKLIPEIAYDRDITILFGTSTFLGGYGKYAHPYDFYSIRYVFAGAEKLKDEVRDLWIDKFGIRVFEGYGTTETAPVLALNTPHFYRRGTVGQFLPAIEYKIEPIEGIEKGGNLLVKGPNVMKGYLLHEKGFIPSEEWYDCGDVVDVDTDGYIHIIARLKRFAKIAGEMVSLNLVEQLAGRCFKSDEMAAVSIPDARKGEKIILYTTCSTAAIHRLKEYLQENGFLPLLLPSKIVCMKQLPLLGSGKVDYVTIKQWAES